jgi:beta-aspartyl-peptidase (threonine type)
MRRLAGEGGPYREGMAVAARAGRDVLAAGGTSLDAVIAACRSMEASGAFNAGLGSCLDEDGDYGLDAALMRGSDRAAGAVGAMTATPFAVDVCRDLLDEGRHVLLVGEGADRRARALGLDPLPPAPADKQEAYQELLAKQQAVGIAKPEDLSTVGRPDDEGTADVGHDTVGAVAVDGSGRVASAVTTGGLWLKAKGRVGDSALVGAGLFACDGLGAAASATGIGERMIRGLTCEVACRVAAAQGAKRGAEAAVDELEARFGALSGGVVVVDRAGGVGASFNTKGMGRALARVGEEQVHVAVWPEDPFPV